MSALEIIAAVVLCIIGFCTIFIWGQVIILIDRIYIRNDNEKKPAPKNETDKEK